jgi:hypothetical protein
MCSRALKRYLASDPRLRAQWPLDPMVCDVRQCPAPYRLSPFCQGDTCKRWPIFGSWAIAPGRNGGHTRAVYGNRAVDKVRSGSVIPRHPNDALFDPMISFRIMIMNLLKRPRGKRKQRLAEVFLQVSDRSLAAPFPNDIKLDIDQEKLYRIPSA